MVSHFFDAHTHTQFAAFKDCWQDVIDRALKLNIWLVNAGTQRDTSKKAVEIANLYNSGVYAAVGLHPIHTHRSHYDELELGGGGDAAGFMSREEKFDYEYYRKLAVDDKVLAIGECGLDYYRLESDGAKELQKKAFYEQIMLSSDVGKPLVIHCRDAYKDLIDILKPRRDILNSPPGIVHFMSGTVDEAKELIEAGFYFSFGGVITFSRNYDELINFIPMDRILSETDSPYVAPTPHRGKRNEPSYVIKVVEKLAEIKGLSVEDAKSSIWENAKSVFGL